MISITTNTDLIADNAWDYPIEELDYLLEEYDGQTFVLVGERLWEAFSADETLVLNLDEDNGELNDDLLDATKADAAWVLNLEPYSDEWFELMDI